MASYLHEDHRKEEGDTHMSTPLKVNNVTVKYGSSVVVDHFEHTFEEGKIHCIMGPNGCGKTTLIKKIVELYSASCSLSYVPQETYGNIALSVYDVVGLGRYDRSRFFTGLTSDDKNKVEEAIALMELEGLEDRIYDTLSGGEKQRCMIARALSQDTEWTILDEPSSNLDVRHTVLTMKTLSKLRDEKKRSFIVVLHDINTAASFADNYILMKKGKLIKATSKLTPDVLSSVFDSSFEEILTRDGKSFYCPS